MNREFPTALPSPDSAPRPPKFVFIHIGKTTGTSLRLTLRDAFGDDACSPPFVQSYLTEADARHYNGFQIICGHISRADQLQWFRDRQVVTVLREPIDRCLSFIHYVRSLQATSSDLANDSKTMPLMEFIESPKAQHNLHNTMVRQLGGHMLDEPTDFPALLEGAKQTLREAMWVGRHSAIAEDLAMLARVLGVPLQMRRDNITPGRPPRTSEPLELLDRLYELNGYDLELWTWARRELFSSAPTDYGKRPA